MNTLAIPDTHFPFEHKRALNHCVTTYERHKCKKVICTGDMIDHHRISRHTTEPDAMGAIDEIKLTLKCIKKWGEVFPVMDIILGNHDVIPYRQAKELGIPDYYLKDLQTIYKMPKRWKFHKKLVKGNVLYLHSAGSGKYAAINKSREQSMSVVVGHTHRNGGVLYYSNPKHLYFGLNVGCLIDKNAYAMRYFEGEPTLGCGVVYSNEEAYFVPMRMGETK